MSLMCTLEKFYQLWSPTKDRQEWCFFKTYWIELWFISLAIIGQQLFVQYGACSCKSINIVPTRCWCFDQSLRNRQVPHRLENSLAKKDSKALVKNQQILDQIIIFQHKVKVCSSSPARRVSTHSASGLQS